MNQFVLVFLALLLATLLGAGVAGLKELIVAALPWRQPKLRTRSGPEMLTREVRVKCRSIDEEKREAEFIAATETPVDMGDDAPEVLRASGATLDPRGLPLLDAHSRSSIENVLGRVAMRKEGRTLVARVAFSDATEAARNAWNLVRDGTVDAVSVGYLVKAYRALRAGEEDVENGDEASRVKGPANVVTAWEPKELSLVPIGADPNARRRAFAAVSTPAVSAPARHALEGELASRHALIRAFCPSRLRDFLDSLLVSDPEITIEAARAKLLEKLRANDDSFSFEALLTGRRSSRAPSNRLPAENSDAKVSQEPNEIAQLIEWAAKNPTPRNGAGA